MNDTSSGDCGPNTKTESRFDVHLAPNWAETSLTEDVRRGLMRMPRSLPPKWLYDDRGSELFDRITRLPEYYPTEREREILAREAASIVALSGADTVIELGSGTSDKTRTLLDAFWAAGSLKRFIPLDVSEQTLRNAASMLSQRYPGLLVHGVVGDFTLHLAKLPTGGRRLVAFLGSTIGNLYEEERRAFFGALADTLSPGDSLLLGTDLIKSIDRLVAAYDDPAGVTALFTTNVLAVVNRELGADFDLDAFEHVPLWDPRHERMDLRLRATRDMHVAVPGAGIEFDLSAGEEIRSEISTKFRASSVRAELDGAGFDVRQFWTDSAGDFGLSLSVLR